MRKCTNCGMENDDKAAYCSGCGSPLETSTTVATKATNLAASNVESPANQADYGAMLTTEKRTWWVENLKHCADILNQYDQMEKSIVRERQYVKQYKGKKYSFFRSFWPFLIIAIFTFYCGLIFIPAIIGGTKDSTLTAVALLAIMAILTILVIVGGVFLARLMTNSSNKKLEKYVQERETKIKEVEKKENQLMDDAFWNFMDSFPQKYQYAIAMTNIAGYFENLRADSLKEALNLYEEQLHRWKLEQSAMQAVQLQQQQMRELKSIRKTSSVSAGASVFTAVHTILK